jgi:glucosamine--fructose-6-phosphate aminotransferase (isomerizing)
LARRISSGVRFEEFTRIPVEVEYASEFRYRNNYYSKDVVIAISQSGETADTMAAIKLAKKDIRIWRL